MEGDFSQEINETSRYRYHVSWVELEVYMDSMVEGKAKGAKTRIRDYFHLRLLPGPPERAFSFQRPRGLGVIISTYPEYYSSSHPNLITYLIDPFIQPVRPTRNRVSPINSITITQVYHPTNGVYRWIPPNSYVQSTCHSISLLL